MVKKIKQCKDEQPILNRGEFLRLKYNGSTRPVNTMQTKIAINREVEQRWREEDWPYDGECLIDDPRGEKALANIRKEVEEKYLGKQKPRPICAKVYLFGGHISAKDEKLLKKFIPTLKKYQNNEEIERFFKSQNLDFKIAKDDEDVGCTFWYLLYANGICDISSYRTK